MKVNSTYKNLIQPSKFNNNSLFVIYNKGRLDLEDLNITNEIKTASLLHSKTGFFSKHIFACFLVLERGEGAITLKNWFLGPKF